MNSPSSLKQISSNTSIKEILEWPFDLRICEPYLLSSNWPILLSDELVVIAEDGTGGVYTTQENTDPEKSPIILISSEGQAGKVANNLTELFATIIALPYWRDLLKFSAGGKLEEMYKARVFLERDMLEGNPDIEDKKRIVIDALELADMPDPVQVLFNAVTSGTAIEIKANDGTLYESLFNRFSVSDNRMWKIQKNKDRINKDM